MAKKGITVKELEKACEGALDKVAEKDNAKPKKKKAAIKTDSLLDRIERVHDRVKDNEELLRVTVELTKDLKTIVLEMQNKMKSVNSRLGLWNVII